MIDYKHWVAALILTGAVVSVPNTGHAVDSIWSAGVGKILPSDEAVFCNYAVVSGEGPFTVTANLQKRATDGTLIQDGYTDATTKLMLRLQCMNTNTQVVSPPITSATFGDTATLQCPAGAVGVHIRCMIRSADASPFVYGGDDLGGDPCGNGVSEITLPAGSNGFKGQITGQRSELNFRSKVGNKLFNQSLMTTAQVHGTDLGYMFYQGGSLWAGYGDTWANTFMVPVAPTRNRGSVLFSTTDLDPSDSNGLSYASFVNNGSPTFAKEVVPSCHNSSPCSEVSAIATAGFGLREGGSAYRILWFASISNWTPFTSTASLAWSVGTGNFKRADKDPVPGGTTPPVWSDASHFGAGGLHQDRRDGMLYFFGQQPYRDNAPIRLARVPAKFASVMDRTKYEYWSGSNWVSDAAHPMAPSEGNYFGPAANIIPTSANVGPEFSVAFDAYANRYIMLLVRDRWSNSNAVELWQSAQLTGPWTKVSSGATRLPNAGTTGGQWLPYNVFYGPYTSEHIMRNGGRSIYYQLSEWNGIPAFRPYNVGLWTFNVNRELTPTCMP